MIFEYNLAVIEKHGVTVHFKTGACPCVNCSANPFSQAHQDIAESAKCNVPKGPQNNGALSQGELRFDHNASPDIQIALQGFLGGNISKGQLVYSLFRDGEVHIPCADKLQI